MANQGALKVITLLDAIAVTADGQGTGQDFLGTVEVDHGEVLFHLSCGAKSGTTPTCDIHLEECDTVDGTYTDITSGSFTQLTDTGSETLRCKPKKRFVRYDVDVGGTSPSFTLSLHAIATQLTT